jgi:hypothetical protein
LGFGVGASVLTNNVAAIGALINGVWPMRKVAQLEAERRHMLELELTAAGYDMQVKQAHGDQSESAIVNEAASESDAEPEREEHVGKSPAGRVRAPRGRIKTNPRGRTGTTGMDA